jgi:C1A family cysteine protease
MKLAKLTLLAITLSLQACGGGYVIVKNSWSSDWGDGGLAYVTYEWLQHSLLDAQALVKLDSVQ